MAFTQEVVKTPTAIDGMTVSLFTSGPNGAGGAASYHVKVVYSDGSVVVRTGDLLPHLTQGQINALIGFMNDLRAKAVDEFLP